MGNSKQRLVLGVKMGRPARITKLQQQEIKVLRQSGATLKELALEYEISTSTVSRIATGTDSHRSRKRPKKEN
ncbi:helix-turn-helix domain-containing protein [Acetobacter senegalensis]|uniref:hypothetical protein n=1 Tax=Acetobacter senegalensis TaxID=446692 RepID=UPI0018D3EF05|nr:hypothetical protein [Acetobacter senegalensis]